MASIKFTTKLFTIISRGVLFLLIWWVLTNGEKQSLWIGIPAVVLATTASTVLLPPTNFVWLQFLRFVPFFLMRSLIGGIDVAWRAFNPSMPIAPDLIEYPTRLPPGLPQVFMASTINLLPGTMSIALDHSVLKVHVLVSQKDHFAEIELVEQNVARMFGVSLQTSSSDK